MKKPTPPYIVDQSNQFKEPSSFNVFDNVIPTHSSLVDQLEEQQGDFLIDDHVIEKTEAGSGLPIESSRICVNCDNYWGLKNLAPVRNKRPDGTPFMQHESFCMYKDKLFQLSERMVQDCTRFKKKDN